MTDTTNANSPASSSLSARWPLALRKVVVAALFAAASMVGCSDDDGGNPTAPSPVNATSVASSVSTPAATTAAGTTVSALGGRTATDGVLEAPDGALTASLEAPSDHDGNPFEVELVFSEPIAARRRDVRDDAFSVTGATITKALRQNRSRSHWSLTVVPSGRTVDVVLAATANRACDATHTGALCTEDGRSLSHALSATIRGTPSTPLTATLEVPSDHDGSPFEVELVFSEPITARRRDVRDDGFSVTGATITKALRQNRSRSHWSLTVVPSGRTVDVVLAATANRSCDESGALCTEDGQSLSHALSATIRGTSTSPDLSIRTLFAVSNLWSTSQHPVTIYATVENSGDESSAATTLRYYRSTDATITTGDTQVGTVAVGALSAGATINSDGITANAPSTPGTYYYGACVDAVPGESDTTNNCGGGDGSTPNIEIAPQ